MNKKIFKKIEKKLAIERNKVYYKRAVEKQDRKTSHSEKNF